VHHQSARAPHAIICVSCLTADVTTPGESPRPADMLSKVSLADGGTLYLEAIQFLSHGVQRKLAELLGTLDLSRQSGEVVQPDVRVIVSTTRSIDEELAAGRVLPELRRRLRRTIDLAPLRDRVDDLPALAHHILHRQAEQTGRIVPLIAADALERLKAYRWPGNLRELRNVLECAVATSRGGGALDISEQLLNDGIRVGSYHLIERLGSGGMGEVWLARHQLLARPAAVKLLRITTSEDDEERTVRQRFEREANATAELQSPHTVQLYDFGVTDTGNFYYVMERLRGMDLQRMIERYGPLPLPRALVFLKQACRSLSEAHVLGLVHRDIKPANLFVCRLGQEYDFLKVLDFGMVSGHARVPTGHVTMAGTVLGTPAFLAPELALNAGPFDGRADIYSLGCVAYWILTGRQPFEADDPMTLLMHHANTEPSPPSEMTEESIPPVVDAIILKCLAKDPKDRPATAEALWEMLEGLRLSGEWNQAQARRWWEQHAPDLVEQT
jgi:Protein kinase domain/Sigma-54 interaction domain